MASIHMTDIESAINWWRNRSPSPDGLRACDEVLALAEVYALMVYYREPLCDEPTMPPRAMQAWLAKELEGRKPRTKSHDKTLSVKVDPDLYARYQHARVILDKSGQELLVEGLQMVLKKHKL
jgi:hypothetical protein